MSSCTENNIEKDLIWDATRDGQRDAVAQESNGGCPELNGKIYSKAVSALVDSGSIITCMSDTMYEELRRENSIDELPISNVCVVTAVGKKTTPIIKQIRVPFEIDGLIVETIFLIVPRLTCDVILGNDWLRRNGVRIDYA